MNSTLRFAWSHAIGSTCSRIMRYVPTSLSWSAVFRANWLVTSVTGYSDIACNLRPFASVSTVRNRTFGGWAANCNRAWALYLAGGTR